MPIPVPAGRHGLQPQLTLGYSTGNGNGPFGLGWPLSRARGVPEDLARRAPVPGLPAAVRRTGRRVRPVRRRGPGRRSRRRTAGRVRYRPRTEGLFARIEHVTGDGGNYWEVAAGTGCPPATGPRGRPARPTWHDPAVVADPPDPGRIFAWRITADPGPARQPVRYDYLADCRRASPAPVEPSAAAADLLRRLRRPGRAVVPGHGGLRVRAAAGPVLRLPRRVRGAHDAAVPGDPGEHPRRRRRHPGRPGVPVHLRAGAVQRGQPADPGRRRRDRRRPAPGQARPSRRCRRSRSATPGSTRPGAGSSGSPAPGLPTGSLADPTLALVDLHGFGLPDVLELGRRCAVLAQRRRRPVRPAPHPRPRRRRCRLADPGVQVLDADGDGRPDLMVTAVGARCRGERRRRLAGYFPMTFAGRVEPSLVPALPAGADGRAWPTRPSSWSTWTATG